LIPMAKREHHAMVVLRDAEVAVLDEHRGSAPRATYLRRLLHGPSNEDVASGRGDADPDPSGPGWEAAGGSSLARELREGGEVDELDP
jgi:hypothetical protein